MSRAENFWTRARRRPAFAAGVVAAVVAAAIAPHPAGAAVPRIHRASPYRILQPPQNHAIVLGRSFRVLAALPADSRAFHARLDSRPITGRFKRRHDGRYAARIPTRFAGGAGFHFLLISYVDSSGRHSLGREVIVARKHQRAHQPPRGRLLTVRAPHGRVAGVARLHLRARRADQWSVRVDGHDVSDRFGDHAGFLRDGALSASTGLHQGVNHVAVLAARDDGTRAVKRFAVRIRRHTPIPDAGRPRRVAAGDRVRLGSPGGAAERSRPGTVLEHSWEILAAPKRSKARLRHPHAQRPSFRPDVKGTYRIADRVTERTRAGRLVGRSARDVVEVAATPAYVPPIGLPIETLASEGGSNELGVKFAGGFYPLEGGQGAVQVMTIDRTTLATSNQSFENAEESLRDVESETVPDGTIVIVEGDDLPGEEGWREAISKQIGAPTKWVTAEGSPGFSVIGVKGIPVGQGWENAVAEAPGNGTTGVLRGYIAPNYELSTNPENATYTFTPSTYFSYDTNTTGAGEGAISVTAQVGPNKVSGSVPGGQTGFLAAEFDAGTLALRSSRSFAIATAGESAPSNQGEIEALAAWLEGRENDPDALVMLQSIGTLPSQPPTPPTAMSGEEGRYRLVEAWARAGRAISRLGGRESSFLASGGGYSFLGGQALTNSFSTAPAAENATTYLSYDQPPVVRLAGTIQLGHLGTLVPATNTPISTPNASVESNPVAVGNFELPLIAYERSTPWPYEPGSANEDAAVVAAGHYISEQVCGGECNDELRHLYAVPNFNLPLLIEESGLSCPAAGSSWEGTGFNKEECGAALAEFEKEYRMVAQLNAYFSTSSDGFLYPLSSVIGEEQAGLETIGNDVDAAVKAASEAPAHIEWLLFAQTFAILGGFTPEPLTTIATLIDAGLNMSETFAVAPSGESIFQLETTVDQTVAQVAAMATTQQEAIGNLKAIIVTDYGKLSRMTADTSGKDPRWNLPSDWSAVKEQLSYGLRGTFYRTFLPSVGAGSESEGFSDVLPLQNVCTTESGLSEQAPVVPGCGGASSPRWTTLPASELNDELVCWFVEGEEFQWLTESMGKHWAEGEYVVAGANAISEWTLNPYYPIEPRGSYMLAYSPRWRVAINENKPFSSREAPFPASVASQISGKPEAGNLGAGLPPWALFEALPRQEPVNCPIEWSGGP